MNKTKTAGIDHPLEEDLWKAHTLILGMDEAGRGPLCGPMTVAGVIFPEGYANPLLNDSKKLSEKKREQLAEQIMEDALAYQILFVSEEQIDSLNIYQAAREGMETIADHLQADWILTDAMPLQRHPNHQAEIKGDARSLSIAAASILAKTARDRYMEQLDREFPQYGLARHKGYPTKAHLEAISEHGVQDFYRRSYSPVQKILNRDRQETLF